MSLIVHGRTKKGKYIRARWTQRGHKVRRKWDKNVIIRIEGGEREGRKEDGKICFIWDLCIYLVALRLPILCKLALNLKKNSIDQMLKWGRMSFLHSMMWHYSPKKS